MSLLTDDERDALFVAHYDKNQCVDTLLVAFEAAILEKLASAELPKPADCVGGWEEPVTYYYTADQIRQAYAQGAASQLSAEPVGEFEALPDPTVGEIPWLNIYDIKSRVVGTKLYTRKEPK